jgi:toxin ParE1/3/4
MGSVKISATAQNDIQNIFQYISEDSTQNAIKVINKIIAAIDSLKTYPDKGLLLNDARQISIRYLKVYKYKIVYRNYAKSVRIITIHHSARLLTNNNALKGYL